jgi:very-short-patch-repair endonuclease
MAETPSKRLSRSDLAEAIAMSLAATYKAYDLEKIARQLGLPTSVDDESPGRSKRIYIRSKVIHMSRQDLLTLAERVVAMTGDPALREQLDLIAEESGPTISSITRSKLIDLLAQIPALEGKRKTLEFFGSVCPIGETSAIVGWGIASGTLADRIWRHVVDHDDWSYADLFEELGLRTWSQARLFSMLRETVHPLTREGAEQADLVQRLNGILAPDGFELTVVSEQSGHSIYDVTRRGSGVSTGFKNLVFAADGPKPDLVLADAVSNSIQIVRNAEYSLIFDRPLPTDGLLWNQLVDWYATREGMGAKDKAVARALYRRLKRSLASPPEHQLFERYFKVWVPRLGDRLPALVPQVYLHYDPLTVKQRARDKVLPRQRMDFLLLLPHLQRVVIEVDGQQHYSHDGEPAPHLYADMMIADRDLRLLGYEVYRFGGHEFGQKNSDDSLDAFFRRLFERHGVS